MHLYNICARLVGIAALGLICAGQAMAATQGAAVIDDGYAGKVLQKILGTGKIKASRNLEVRLSLDDAGNIVDCRAVKGGDAGAICAAAKSVAPFGTTPYGVPVTISLALWAGKSGASSSDTAAQSESAGSSSKYLEQAARQIRNSIYIPEKTKKGTYHATARIKLDKDGKILDRNIVKGSGDALLDKYILQGISRAGQVSPPPSGKNVTVDLTFTLVRQ